MGCVASLIIIGMLYAASCRRDCCAVEIKYEWGQLGFVFERVRAYVCVCVCACVRA